jgi:POT family proton-dependent oligopeptide transporter
MLVLTVFVVFSKKVNKLPPQGSPILDASNAIKIALKEKSFEKAKPSVLRENQRLELYAFAQSVSYTDTYVEQVKSGLLACKVIFVSVYSLLSMLTWLTVLLTLPVLHNLLDPDFQQLDLSSWCNGPWVDTKRLDAEPLDCVYAGFYPSSGP